MTAAPTHEKLSLTQGEAVSLQQMLEARERRGVRQCGMLETHGRPVISLTPVLPGAIKNSPGARFLLQAACDAIVQCCHRQGWSILAHETIAPISGPEALFSVDTVAEALKRAMLDLEESHPLGRLWDIDVLCPSSGALSRRALSMAPRRCLVCNEAAHACARSRRHALETLLAVMEEHIDAYRRSCS